MKQQLIRATFLSIFLLFNVSCQQKSTTLDSTPAKETLSAETNTISQKNQSSQTIETQNDASETINDSIEPIKNSVPSESPEQALPLSDNVISGSTNNLSSNATQERELSGEVITGDDRDTLVKQNTGSSLTGKVSDLEGAIAQLNGRISETEIIIPLPADVLFDFDEANIRNNAIPTLERLGQAIANLDSQSIQINGHTDSKGSESYNLQLSQARAEAVATWLSNNTKISGDRLIIRGYGESQPFSDNQTPDGRDNPEGRAKNRRVEIIIPQ